MLALVCIKCFCCQRFRFQISLQIVSKDLSDPVRSHKDLDKDAAPFFKKAVKFYEGLAKQLVGQGHVLDIFASALDQVCASIRVVSCLKNSFTCKCWCVMVRVTLKRVVWVLIIKCNITMQLNFSKQWKTFNLTFLPWILMFDSDIFLSFKFFKQFCECLDIMHGYDIFYRCFSR